MASVKLPEPAYQVLVDKKEGRDMTLKEATREVFQEAGYDV
jgi:hypothetical protein